MLIRTKWADTELIWTYSDQHMKIRQNETGIIYDEAIDVPDAQYTYTETTEPIEDPEIQPEEEGYDYE